MLLRLVGALAQEALPAVDAVLMRLHMAAKNLLLQPNLNMLRMCVTFLYPLPRALKMQCFVQNPTPSNVLGVFGLSIRTTERDLDEEFSRFGRVEKVTIVYDQRVSFIF